MAFLEVRVFTKQGEAGPKGCGCLQSDRGQGERRLIWKVRIRALCPAEMAVS